MSTRINANLFECRQYLRVALLLRVTPKVAAHTPLERRERLRDATVAALLGERLRDVVLVEGEELLRGGTPVLLELRERKEGGRYVHR